VQLKEIQRGQHMLLTGMKYPKANAPKWGNVPDIGAQVVISPTAQSDLEGLQWFQNAGLR